MKAGPRRLWLALLGFGTLAGCGEGEYTAPPPLTPTALVTRPATPLPSAGAQDPLGAKPRLGSPKPFEPPVPQIFKGQGGMTVWLLERHSLPMVSVTLSIPVGSARDPEDSPGLAYITADMLDEGAGGRSAVELSSAINDLGASLATGAGADGSFVSLTVLKKNFEPAFAILSDVVARPRFDPKEWKRVSSLWQNGLKKRADDPASVARVVSGAALYGPGTPYGHPSDGLLRGARKIDLAAAKAFYGQIWHPEQAALVVAGDITKAEVERIAGAALASWKPAGPPPSGAPAPVLTPAPTHPRLILVDRKDAPQAMVSLVRDGVRASDPAAAPLELINTALGGSFTSRLNQSLREDHGWTYGARTSFSERRGEGAFFAGAAVHTEVTGLALKEMLDQLSKMASSGLSDEELKKVQAQDRGDVVQTYETVSSITRRLGTLAQLGLPPNFDALATSARQRASLAQLAELARAHVDPKNATIIVVGPRDKVAPQLATLSLGEPELWDAEGQPLKAAVAAPAKKEPGPKEAAPSKTPPKK